MAEHNGGEGKCTRLSAARRERPRGQEFALSLGTSARRSPHTCRAAAAQPARFGPDAPAPSPESRAPR
eukprot:3019480-Pyramimonas_sp.AAC.1